MDYVWEGINRIGNTTQSWSGHEDLKDVFADLIQHDPMIQYIKSPFFVLLFLHVLLSSKLSTFARPRFPRSIPVFPNKVFCRLPLIYLCVISIWRMGFLHELASRSFLAVCIATHLLNMMEELIETGIVETSLPALNVLEVHEWSLTLFLNGPRTDDKALSVVLLLHTTHLLVQNGLALIGLHRPFQLFPSMAFGLADILFFAYCLFNQIAYPMLFFVSRLSELIIIVGLASFSIIHVFAKCLSSGNISPPKIRPILITYSEPFHNLLYDAGRCLLHSTKNLGLDNEMDAIALGKSSSLASSVISPQSSPELITGLLLDVDAPVSPGKQRASTMTDTMKDNNPLPLFRNWWSLFETGKYLGYFLYAHLTKSFKTQSKPSGSPAFQSIRDLDSSRSTEESELSYWHKLSGEDDSTTVESCSDEYGQSEADEDDLFEEIFHLRQDAQYPVAWTLNQNITLPPSIQSIPLKQRPITRQYAREIDKTSLNSIRTSPLQLTAGNLQSPSTTDSISSRNCVVCQVDPRHIVLRPCGCLCMCDGCRERLALHQYTNCPCCRKHITGYSRIYDV